MTILLAIIRTLHFAASLLPLSVFAVLLLVVNPAAGGAAEHFRRQLHRLLAACFIAVFGSGFCWLWFSIAGMSGASLKESLDAGLFKMVLEETAPGHVWILRGVVAFLLAITAAIFFRRGKSKIGALPLCFCAFLGACLSGSLAWLGHAGAAEGRLADIHLAADVLHLISAAVWPGGLLPFALFIRLLLKSRDATQLSTACSATRRFSSMSLVAVGVLAASGCVNSYFLVGNFQALFSTGYGRLLLLKLTLFTGMIAIGAINLLLIKPRFSCIPENEGELRQIAGNVMMELCLGAVLLLVVGILGITAPAIHP